MLTDRYIWQCGSLYNTILCCGEGTQADDEEELRGTSERGEEQTHRVYVCLVFFFNLFLPSLCKTTQNSLHRKRKEKKPSRENTQTHTDRL